MATLAEQIVIDLAILIADATLIDLSRQRDETDTENTARTAKVAAHAAAMIESRLGDGITDEDVAAVDLGCRLALLRYSQVYKHELTPEGLEYVRGVRTELRELREIRVAGETEIALTDHDFTDLDKRFPGTQWET